MPRVKDVELSNDAIELVASEAFTKKATIAFYAERDSFQENLKMEARKAKVETIPFYLNLMLDQALESRYEYALSKREKVLKAAMSVLLATGKSESEARKMLGLGE